MCQEWQADFMAFFRHIGPRPSKDHSLDRIDVNGNYEPGNVRWATKKEQSNNQRKNIRFIHAGRSMTLAEVAEHEGINYFRLRDHLLRKDLHAAISVLKEQ